LLLTVRVVVLLEVVIGGAIVFRSLTLRGAIGVSRRRSLRSGNRSVLGKYLLEFIMLPLRGGVSIGYSSTCDFNLLLLRSLLSWFLTIVWLRIRRRRSGRCNNRSIRCCIASIIIIVCWTLHLN
jgi:hypothetical protein